MILYVDTSALVKRYVLEPGSENVNALLEQAETVASVALTRVEMASALAKAARMNWVDIEEAQSAWQDFLSHWPSFVRLSLTQPLTERASRLSWEYGLRAYDATHLAAGLLWQETLEMPVNLATYDRELWLAGQKAGLSVWPENLAS
ncbi:MAG: type II toxin-antitoxin system VapC family toxin [Anaerolineales bacterium]|jgi:predicted nucleic acid-binding protein|nr:type II toxin-antitoxin system VapC family toxin [Anaerolineales bacterium]